MNEKFSHSILTLRELEEQADLEARNLGFKDRREVFHLLKNGELDNHTEKTFGYYFRQIQEKSFEEELEEVRKTSFDMLKEYRNKTADCSFNSKENSDEKIINKDMEHREEEGKEGKGGGEVKKELKQNEEKKEPEKTRLKELTIIKCSFY